jgi:hypothetical protein
MFIAIIKKIARVIKRKVFHVSIRLIEMASIAVIINIQSISFLVIIIIEKHGFL